MAGTKIHVVGCLQDLFSWNSDRSLAFMTTISVRTDTKLITDSTFMNIDLLLSITVTPVTSQMTQTCCRDNNTSASCRPANKLRCVHTLHGLSMTLAMPIRAAGHTTAASRPCQSHIHTLHGLSMTLAMPIRAAGHTTADLVNHTYTHSMDCQWHSPCQSEQPATPRQPADLINHTYTDTQQHDRVFLCYLLTCQQQDDWQTVICYDKVTRCSAELTVLYRSHTDNCNRCDS